MLDKIYGPKDIGGQKSVPTLNEEYTVYILCNDALDIDNREVMATFHDGSSALRTAACHSNDARCNDRRTRPNVQCRYIV